MQEITEIRVPFGGCVGCGCSGAEGDSVGFLDTAISLAERGYGYFQGKKKAAAAKQKAARTAAFNKQQRLKLEAAQDQTAELRRQIEQERRDVQHRRELEGQREKLQRSIRDQKARADDAC